MNEQDWSRLMHRCAEAVAPFVEVRSVQSPQMHKLIDAYERWGIYEAERFANQERS